MMDFHDIEFIYQLNCNQAHNMFFYIELLRDDYKIKIFKITKGVSEYYMDYKLNKPPISCGWISNDYIFLQLEESLISFNVKTANFKELFFPKHKIFNIITNEDTYIYSTVIDSDYIDFYKCTISDKIATYSIIKKNFIGLSDDLDIKEKKTIIKYMESLEIKWQLKAYDIFEGHVLQINEDPIYSSIYINNNKILTIYGSIDRAIYIGKEIVFTFSSFLLPQTIRVLNLNENALFENEKKDSYETSVVHNENSKFMAPHYQLFPVKKIIGSILMLHGGPYANYLNQYDPLVSSLLDIGLVVYLLNYTGSSGYGREYKENLYGAGGRKDFIDVKKSILEINKRNKNVPLFVFGDSYGGYLSILTLLKNNNKVKKFYATNAFTDIRYQFLFSASRAIISKYFPKIDSNKLKKVNPIDLVDDSMNLKSKLLIINGLNDYYCPHYQIQQFAEITHCKVKFIKDYPHFKVGYFGQWDINKLIIDDIRKTINA